MVQPEISPDPHFERLFVRLQEGDNEAAREVFDRYWAHLLNLAARQFETWLRERADPEGIVQSALCSFFNRAKNGQLVPDGWEETAAVLAVITFRKCSNRKKFLLADKRDIRRDHSLADALPEGTPVELADPWNREPSEAAVFSDLLESLLRGFEDRERRIIALSLEGCSLREISERLERPIRSVRRVLDKVRERMRRLREAEGLPP